MSPAQLRQEKLKLQNISFQNIASPHVLELLPDKPVSAGHCVLRVSLRPWAGGYPLFELFLGDWLQNDCQSGESIPESNPETCLLLCLSYKEAIHYQRAFVFTTALLCFACVQHFILRILKCSINSGNCVRVCTLLTVKLGELHMVICSLITEIGIVCCLLLFSAATGCGSEWITWEAEEHPPELLTHGPMCLTTGSCPSSEISVTIAKAVLCKEHKTIHACRF